MLIDYVINESVVHDVCALFIRNYKTIFREETDERVNSENMLYQQITSLNRVNLQTRNEEEELKQYSRHLSLRINGGICQGERGQVVF